VGHSEVTYQRLKDLVSLASPCLALSVILKQQGYARLASGLVTLAIMICLAFLCSYSIPALKPVLILIAAPIRRVEWGTYAAVRSSMFTPVILVAIFFGVSQFEKVQVAFPSLLRWQLRVNKVIYRLGVPEYRSTRVVLVEIDDATFWHPPLSGILPTNRRFIADLARIAARSGAAVVALDFQLRSPFSSPGDDNIRRGDNEYLLSTIRKIAKDVPLVLACGLSVNTEGEWRRIPSIFDDRALPMGTLVGHINLRSDLRLIPPRVEAWKWDGASRRSFDSFAFQIANAYDPRIGQDATVRRTILRGESLYGGFVKDSVFVKISAGKLWTQTDQSIDALLRNRIVIIGGVWHLDGGRGGPLVDGFLSPIGILPGMYVNANYVEALIDQRFTTGIPRWIIASAVVSVAALLSFLFFWVKRLVYRFAILGFFLSAWLVSSGILAYKGQQLDFTTPVVLCFFQLFLAYFEDLRHIAAAKFKTKSER
jgi:CHASE2 domain-containing sensor protein